MIFSIDESEHALPSSLKIGFSPVSVYIRNILEEPGARLGAEIMHAYLVDLA